jgi:hypothetical protein
MAVSVDKTGNEGSLIPLNIRGRKVLIVLYFRYSALPVGNNYLILFPFSPGCQDSICTEIIMGHVYAFCKPKIKEDDGFRNSLYSK